MNINTVVLAGRLTRDVDLRSTQGGVGIANIGLAINRRTKRQGEWVDEPVFVDVKLFGKRAEAFARFHSKGDIAVFPNCELVLESWERNGERRQKLVVHAQGFEFAGRREGSASGGETPPDAPF